MSGILAGAGLLAAAAACAVAILLPPGRARSAAMLLALALFPLLILGDQWHTQQIVDLRHSGARTAALAASGLVAVAALAYLFRRWPVLLPLAIVAAVPFRIPLHSGGDTANLLVPLYLVIAGGVLAVLLRDWPALPAGGAEGEAENGASLPRPQASPSVAPGGVAAVWLPRILAAVVVVYGVQTLYSEDFSKGLQNMCFFLVPFTVAFALLQDVEWDNRVLRWVLFVVIGEALAFVLIGGVEYASRSLFWNDAVIRSNEFHTYFRVNSVFWDPNVYGRYLALVLVVVTTALLWAKRRRDFWLLAVAILVLWVGLAQTFSQSSFIALLAGLAVLAAIRWSWRWTLGAVLVGLVAAVLVVTLVGGSGKINFSRLNIDTSGRANLVQGGVDLFAERPLWGYGSGSFQHAYADHGDKSVPVSVSHTEPVTVIAEQGLIGLFFYLALILTALWAMTAGLRGRRAGRAAVLAAFVALLVHTMSYAGFFEDPITWVLLAIGAALASTPYVPASVRDPA
ncbi:MAG: O-antigen ligase family protein [Solirubrobacterales bacterium]|nr:O-antigen ligase family protein [Solirubrobacterales bacterium]